PPPAPPAGEALAPPSPVRFRPRRGRGGRGIPPRWRETMHIKHMTLLRDTMTAALAYDAALQESATQRDTLRGFLDSCRHVGIADTAMDPILKAITVCEENSCLAPGALAEDYRDEELAARAEDDAYDAKVLAAGPHPDDPPVPSLEERVGANVPGHEWFELAGLGDKEGKPDPGLAYVPVAVARGILNGEIADGPGDTPWRLDSGTGYEGTSFDLVTAVLDMVDALGRPVVADGEYVRVFWHPTLDGTLTAEMADLPGSPA
ncbi:MAG: hypothetical protein OXE50_06725, partial [Chloroflexi bacterium]|nr:hypothetical protein [Chloroflexota bacterium]